MQKYAQRDHRKLYSTVVATSRPRRALPSLNPSDDSHERSRETGRKCDALGLLNVLTRKRYPPCIRLNARVLCLVIITLKLRGPFNEHEDITSPAILCQSILGGSSGGQAIYKSFHAPKFRDISAIKKTDINSRRFIRAVCTCKIFPGKVHKRVSTEVFLGIYQH